jgi:diadenosine tetraphosphate (Ap4A) HIT family hydrolase
MSVLSGRYRLSAVSTATLDSSVPDRDSLADSCRFCDAIATVGRADEQWRVIDETEHLLAVPSVGALVPGWLLVVPRFHALSFGSLGCALVSSLSTEVGQIADRWERKFGAITWFEHGPRQPNSAVGCSIDHAHIHLVPLGELDLLSEARGMLPDLQFRQVAGLIDTCSEAEGGDYVYIRTPQSTSWLATGTGIPSQAVRRVIASHQGREAEYDWKQYLQLETLRETIRLASD